ncbi:MAG: glycosyl transferase family 2, partial [Muribaculaceae bacterium]|nr:glycosyl transferase family 2 [Muribaculaceae bacterium]
RLIRVCADNVFLDMESFRYLYDRMTFTDADYESFCTHDGTPSIRTHYGFWTEGVTTSALERVATLTNESLYHEHVTNFIYANPDKFQVRLTPVDQIIPEVEQHEGLRLTLDTAEDFSVQQTLFGYLTDSGLDVTPQEIFRYMQTHPDVYAIMKQNIQANSK